VDFDVHLPLIHFDAVLKFCSVARIACAATEVYYPVPTTTTRPVGVVGEPLKAVGLRETFLVRFYSSDRFDNLLFFSTGVKPLYAHILTLRYVYKASASRSATSVTSFMTEVSFRSFHSFTQILTPPQGLSARSCVRYRLE
jgi:hypothetical protein